MTAVHDNDLRTAVLRVSRRARLERVGDLTETQTSALFTLLREGPQALGSLSELERVTPPAMSRTVRILADLGLLTQRPAADDGRKLVIEATPAGAEVAEGTRQLRAAWFISALATLSAEERAVLDAATPILLKLAER